MKIESLTTKDLEFYFSDKFFYFGKTEDNGWFLTSDGVFKLDLAVSAEKTNNSLDLDGSLFHLSKVCNKRCKVREKFSVKELGALDVIYKKGNITPSELEKIGKVLHESMRCRMIFNKCQKALLDYAKQNSGEAEM